jgi:hypothetical protein
MRDHKDRGGQETGNLRKQFKNSENFSFIFQIRKQQETRKTRKFRFLPKKMRKFFFAPLARSKHDSASIENRGSRNADFSEI